MQINIYIYIYIMQIIDIYIYIYMRALPPVPWHAGAGHRFYIVSHYPRQS